jgi:hypothetical protein
MSDYRLDDRGSIPAKGSSSGLCVQTSPEAHPASFTMGKGRPGRDADRSPPSSAEVKND